jgi:hypothetical protein
MLPWCPRRAGRHELAHALLVASARRAHQLRWPPSLLAPLGAHRVKTLQPRRALYHVGLAAEKACAVEAVISALSAEPEREAADIVRVVQVERVAEGAHERQHVQQ